MAFVCLLGSSKWWHKVKYIFLRFYLRSLLLLKLTCWKNLAGIVIKSVDIVHFMKYIHFMVLVTPFPYFRWDLEILGWFKKGEAGKICYFRGDPKFKGGGCDPLGHHAFVKYLILFMIIYMMVKLGLVLWFLRIEKVLKCCVNFVLLLSTYMIILLGIPLSVEVIPAR